MKTILVAGSKEFECGADREREIAEKLGAAVAREASWRLLTGGAIGKSDRCGKDKGGVDYHAAIGAQRAIADPEKEREKILTIHPRDGRSDLFQIGAVSRSRAKSTPARRFELVSRADVIVLIEGHEGSAQIVEYSVAAGKPVIPLACTGGESRRVWEPGRFRAELLQSLGVQDPSSELDAIEKGGELPEVLIDTCIHLMRRLLRPACFVVMPFNLSHSKALWEDVLRPAIEQTGLTATRGDLVFNVGEILEDVRRCITEAAVVVVDISGTNPNVMYELGYAHALGKPTVLVCSTGDSPTWDKDLPFDIRGMRIIPIDTHGRQTFHDKLTASLRPFAGSK